MDDLGKKIIRPKCRVEFRLNKTHPNLSHEYLKLLINCWRLLRWEGFISLSRASNLRTIRSCSPTGSNHTLSAPYIFLICSNVLSLLLLGSESTMPCPTPQLVVIIVAPASIIGRNVDGHDEGNEVSKAWTPRGQIFCYSWVCREGTRMVVP